MTTPEELASRAKIKSVKDQIAAVERVRDESGGVSVIDCPYCGTRNYDGTAFCCDTLRTCIVTILMGNRQEKIEEAQTRYLN
jgi:hypothetical protein